MDRLSVIIAMWDCTASIKLLKKEDVLSETRCEGVIRYTHLLSVTYSPCSFIDLKKRTLPQTLIHVIIIDTFSI